MTNSTKVGVIGLGGAGRAHLDYYRRAKTAQIVGVMDPRASELSELLAKEGLHHTRICTTVEQVLSIPGLEAVSICSPDETHFEYAAQALLSGKHVLCEKPVVLSAAEGNQLIDIVEKSGKVFASFHQLRFHRPYEAAKQIIDSGELGEIFCVEGDYIHSLRERAGMFDDWRLRQPFGQPPQLGGGIHFTDLFLWFLNDNIQECYSYSNSIAFPSYPDCDCVMSIMRFERGSIGKVITAFGVSMPQNFKIRIYGSKGSIINNMVFLGERFDRFIHLPAGGVKQTILTNLIKRWPLPSFRDFPFYDYDHKAACLALVKDFLLAIRAGLKPRSDVVSGVKASLASLNQTQSYRLTSPVRG